MPADVQDHYGGSRNLADRIRQGVLAAGADAARITTADLTPFDEFHIRGRKATLELAERMGLTSESRVLDIGSGFGGPARTVAEVHGCAVTGIDLTPALCDAANALSQWVGLGDRTTFHQGDGTALPFASDAFDAAMTIHAAMNIPAKDRMYEEACRVLRPGGIFAVYDILQGEGGDVLFPVPWAREPSISALATPEDMETLLTNAGFRILETIDSTEESQQFFETVIARMRETDSPSARWKMLFGDDYAAMAQNQIRNVTERRIRTVSYICEA